MKKITLLFAFIGMISLQSCTVNEEPDNDIDHDTISEVFEFTNVDFFPEDDYSVILDYPHAIYTTDMVLVYRLAGNSSVGDVWKPLPETYYFDDGTLDYGFNNDFTRYDAQINLYGFDLPNLSNNLKLNQIFRVVVIPAFENKSAATIDFKDYNAVVKAFNIDESKIKKMN